MSNIDKLKLIWDGEIPICFTLAGDEISTVKQPDPIFLMIARQSYLPLFREKLTRYFSSFVNDPTDIWFEYQGQPIKCHYPVGLIYDLCNSQLPWRITVHLENFPEDSLVNYASTAAIESNFMMMVKEADSLKHNGRIIGEMQERQHKQLWSSLMNNNFDDFWTVNMKLMCNKNEYLFKYIPFRIHMRDHPYIQELYKPLEDNGSSRTLYDLLEYFAPEYKSSDVRVLIHGCEFPLDVPLQWASENLSYADNFLHVVLSSES